MIPNRYAVVREAMRYEFTKWYEDYEEAKVEAERLCKKEGVPFNIIRMVAYCHIAEQPVKWEE